MSNRIENITAWLRNEFGLRPEQIYPARDKQQIKYRAEFGDIVDKYLIYYDSDRDDNHPNAFHRIVFIDADNDIDWFEDGNDALTEEQIVERNRNIAKLDVLHSAPTQNLSSDEVFTFKKMLGSGYSAALSGDTVTVDYAIQEAEKYRNDRNKERSRWLLLTAATFYLLVIATLYVLFLHYMKEHPHFELFTGIVMGAVGSYVSIWSRYGKLDMTGLGTRWLHYLESMARMVIGAIFAFVIICALKSGLVFTDLTNSEHLLCLYIVLCFIAGFSEKFVPSVLESFINKKED